MTLRAYFKLVEIQTKVASVFPFALGTLYAWWRFGRLNPGNLLLMLLSLLCFDMATTAINNYMDFRTAKKTSGYGYEQHNAMVRYGVSGRAALAAILVLLILAVLLGSLLALRTGWIVLLLGAVSFGVGITYTWGPVPTSRTPFSELLSGLTMGFLIPFLAAYIHIPDLGIYTLGLSGPVFTASADLAELGAVFLFSLPSVCGIAGIMLANNICDRQDDRENGRFTLPLSIGLGHSLRLLCGLYLLGVLSIPAAALAGVAPPAYLLAVAAALPVSKRLKRFCRRQEKGEDFVLLVQSYVLLEVFRVLFFSLGLLLPRG